MPKFRKKPIVIEAFCLGVDNIPDWFMNGVSGDTVKLFGAWGEMQAAEITTLEGVMRAERGEYVIRGIKGEIYPCKPDIFEATYEPAE